MVRLRRYAVGGIDLSQTNLQSTMVRLRLPPYGSESPLQSVFTIHYGEIKTMLTLTIKNCESNLQSTMVRLRRILQVPQDL